MNKQLWAPWRDAVIYHRTTKRCIFCTKPKERKDAKNYIFMRRRYTFAMLNLYPYNNGHIMVVPYRHVKSLQALTQKELSALVQHLRDCEKLLREVLKPHGFNIGLNVGRAAGAGFENHIHFHIVPRWNGDTNYMPVLSGVKIISESLNTFYQKVHDADVC
ncbi:MAG: HIT domain-containing protein [Candidatus Omnitrophota bacterium]